MDEVTPEQLVEVERLIKEAHHEDMWRAYLRAEKDFAEWVFRQIGSEV